MYCHVSGSPYYNRTRYQCGSSQRNINASYTMIILHTETRSFPLQQSGELRKEANGSIINGHIIYINDLANICKYMMPLSFADDTNLFRGGKNIDDIHDEISHDLDSISEWLKSNKLSLNIKKLISLYLQGMGPRSHMLTYVLIDTLLVK